MYEKITLPSGVRLLFEEIPYVSSAAVGIWVGSGSRHEPDVLGGISHAIEHMVFKGTHTHSAAQIAARMDAIGGQVNAFTTKECTCFYVRALHTHLPEALDVLTDIFFSPRMEETDWQNERKVILEEIDMYEDTPEDLVSERLFSSVFHGNRLAQPILGTPDSLEGMSAADLAGYMRENYRPTEVVVAMSGKFSQADKDYLIERFSALEGQARSAPPRASFRPGFTVKKKKIEQNHLCLAFPSLSFRDGRRYVLQTLTAMLGGGMSSRLFQTVREDRGLCYSVYSFGAAHEEVGLFGIYTALSPEAEEEALPLILDVVRRFVNEGPTSDELERAREQAKANVLMGLESTSARMNHLARNELLIGTIPTPEEIIAGYDAVTRAQVMALSEEIFRMDQIAFSAVGKVGPAARYRALLS